MLGTLYFEGLQLSKIAHTVQQGRLEEVLRYAVSARTLPEDFRKVGV